MTQEETSWEATPFQNDLYIDCCFNNLTEEYFEANRIDQANYQRRKRLRERITNIILNNESLFLTLTFNDEALQATTEKQRRTAVSRFLKQFNSRYVANIDYGAKNHREHYHAVIGCSHVDIETWTKKYGTIYAEHIRLKKDRENDIVKLSKYIAKLTNHAIKETTKRCALLYSRE